MPRVGKKKFPYTPAGKTAATQYKKTIAGGCEYIQLLAALPTKQ